MQNKVRVVLVQLGSPKTPDVKHVRSFLKTFLGDPRVVDMNPTAWKIILYLFVLPFRPAKSAQAYRRIWSGTTFPLIENTKKFAAKVQGYAASNIIIEPCFLLSTPTVTDVLDKIEQADDGCELLIIPQFPQYAESTTASVIDVVTNDFKHRVNIPAFSFITSYHNSKAFIDNSVRLIENSLKSQEIDVLLFSFHGLPKRRILYKNDPYYTQCYETYYLIKQNLSEELRAKVEISFQSRFGSEEWLTPATQEIIFEFIDHGRKKIAVYCPSFVVDCLETTDEIGNELAAEAKKYGGEIISIPCLNDDDQWAQDFAQLVNVQVNGSMEENETNYYQVKKMEINVPEQKMKSPPLSKEAKGTLKIVFLTLFLDLVGFSIIFPLFPALAKHYMAVDADNFLLKGIFDFIALITNVNQNTLGINPIVLFGGVLGALYSFLQFLAAPFWGAVSDKIGRKPVLLISVSGLAFSYLLWFFSGSFTLLIIARIFGGIMGGNISTATAVVADITSKENRSKGMAFVGIAFALGFIIGPAMGAIFHLVKFDQLLPALVPYGVNPFSGPALFSFILAMFNIYWLSTKFKESLPKEKRGQGVLTRSANILKLFKPLPYKGVNLTNFGHFFFLAAFSGMEFTLTFLAVERLAYTPMDNAYMFIYIGFIIALVQGGVVRRKAHEVGEKKMVLMGLLCLIPGLIIIGYAASTFTLYVGLFFLACGSSMAIPCLTSLVSLYTPAESQGYSIGVFRSLGALARVIGPLAACMIYWKYGSLIPYLAGALSLLIPIAMISKLPAIVDEQV